MIIDRNETPQELAFTLTLPQLRQAHEIYKKHCFFQDFIECCEERRTEETGLCNLPYQTLEHETDILCKAYELYEKQDVYKRQGNALPWSGSIRLFRISCWIRQALMKS